MLNWATFYGLLTAVTVGFAWVRRRHSEDALGAAYVLAFLWLASNASHHFLQFDDPYNQFFPILDVGTSAALVWGWRKSLEPWKFALIILLMTDEVIHSTYLNGGKYDFQDRYDYDLKLNLLYICQLLCVVAGALGKRRQIG